MTTGKNFYVYKIANQVNGKFYIGITGKTAESRFKQHVYQARHKARYSRLASAIIKYGKEKFSVEVLEEHQNDSETKAAEIRLIKDLKPHYNVTLGGDGTSGHVMSDEQKEAARQRLMGNKINLGRKWTEAQKKAMSEKKKGCKPPPLNQLMIVTRAENMRRAAKNKRKKVICLSDGRTFDSADEASRAYGFHDKTVASVCSGRRKAVYGLRFSYLEMV